MSFIADRRKELGMTQREVSIASGLTVSAISMLEQRKYNPAATSVVRLAKALKCEPGDILNDITL